VEKNGEGSLDSNLALACYRIRQERGQPRFTRRIIQVEDQFSDGQPVSTRASKVSLLCLPSTVVVPPPPPPPTLLAALPAPHNPGRGPVLGRPAGVDAREQGVAAVSPLDGRRAAAAAPADAHAHTYAGPDADGDTIRLGA